MREGVALVFSLASWTSRVREPADGLILGPFGHKIVPRQRRQAPAAGAGSSGAEAAGLKQTQTYQTGLKGWERVLQRHRQV